MDLVFDSNAVRNFGALTDSQWVALLRRWRARRLTTAWVPRVISEVAGTNLDQKRGLSQRTLEQIVRGIRRFDILAGGAILCDEREAVRRSLFALAGRGMPISIKHDRSIAGWREVLDHAKQLDSVNLIEVDSSNGKRRIILKSRANPDVGVAVIPTDDFELEAEHRIDFWRRRTKCKRRAQLKERVIEIVEFLPEFAKAAVRNADIGVPVDVARDALKARAVDLFNSAFGYRLVVESWYLHLRATGDKESTENNDMADIVIATYLAYGRQIVTDDANLRSLLEAVLEDRRGVVGFAPLLGDLAAS